MARNLTPEMESATTAETVVPVVLVEALFDSGAVRMFSGIGELSFNSQTYLGAGNLLGVGGVQETQELRATGIDITVSGIPSEMLSLALSEPYQGRICRVYLGALDTNTGALIGSPYQIFSGSMDVMSINEGGETASIGIAVESRLLDLERGRERRYEHEDQQIDYPGDMFFQYVPTLQDATITWGRG